MPGLFQLLIDKGQPIYVSERTVDAKGNLWPRSGWCFRMLRLGSGSDGDEPDEGCENLKCRPVP